MILHTTLQHMTYTMLIGGYLKKNLGCNLSMRFERLFVCTFQACMGHS